MNLGIRFFLGLSVFECVITIARGDLEDAMEAVTPAFYPVQILSTEQEKTLIRGSSQAQSSTTAPHTANHGNQKSTGCPTVAACCVQRQLSNTCQNNGSELTPYPCSPACCQCSSVSVQCCLINAEVVASPPPALPETTQPPPVIKCPPGTQLLERRCHLLHCPRGSLMVDGQCVVIECPLGSVWTGHRCALPEPTVHQITVSNTIVTQFNQTKPDVILNYRNNFAVDASLTWHEGTNSISQCNDDGDDDDGDCDDTVSSSEVTLPSIVKCCDVMTPRICEHHNNRWRCYSRRYRRCGEFCIAPIIYLKPSRVRSRPQYLVMPPMENDCQSNGNCGPFRGKYDCSGCEFNNMERCFYYCFRYVCPRRRCSFYEQEKYCAHNAGFLECQETGGCFENWCL